MALPLVDARYLAEVAGYFAQTVTIQQATENQDAMGAVTQTWSDLAGCVNLTCCFWQPNGRIAGGEKRLPDGTFLFGESYILLQGAYPFVTEKMRAVFNDLLVDENGNFIVDENGNFIVDELSPLVLDILLTSTDSQNLATLLTCQLLR